MKSRFSQEMLNEISDRVMRLKQASEETNLNLTNELVKTLGQFSQISKLDTSDLDYSNLSDQEDHELIEESVFLRQPTNSILSISSLDSKTSLITSIKNKNSQLQKTCSEKITELRHTAKELCLQKAEAFQSIVRDEVSEVKPMNNSKVKKPLKGRKRRMSGSAYSSIVEELSLLKKELGNANSRILESTKDISRYSDESLELKNQLQMLLKENPSNETGVSCGCVIT